MSLRILFDVDGVLARFDLAYLYLINAAHGTKHRPEDITDWDIGPALGLSPEEDAAIYAKCRAPGFASNLLPYPGAVEAIRRIRAEHDVYIVTSPLHDPAGRCSWTSDREEWLYRHFEIDRHHVVHTSAKHLVQGDVFIDDRPENVATWQDANPQGWGLLWYQPYNYASRGSNMVCHSWEHLREILELI